MARQSGIAVVVILILLIIFFLVPAVPFVVKGHPCFPFCVLPSPNVGPPLANNHPVISGTYSLSCSILGIGLMRVTGVTELGPYFPSLYYTGWDNYCSNPNIANGTYFPDNFS
jgi:hypothetical protein